MTTTQLPVDRRTVLAAGAVGAAGVTLDGTAAQVVSALRSVL